MIKWAGYGKSLKLLFFGLLISCFTILGNSSVSADDISHNLPYNFYTQDINNVVDNNINFENVGQNQISNNRLYLKFNSSERKFIFRRNGKIYFYQKLNGYFDQGYFTKVCKIYSETGFLNGLFGNCDNISNIYDISEFYNLENPVFTKIYILPNAGTNIIGIYDSVTKYFYFLSQEYLSGTLNLPSDIIDISEYAENSIFTNGSAGSSVVNNNSVITGDFVYSECTVGQAKKLAEDSGLSPYVCYAGLNISYTGLQIGTAGTGSSVFELFQSTNDGKNFKDWFNYRDKIFDNRYVYSDTIRQDKPSALYSYFNFYNQYGPEFTSTDIENYCRIIVNNLSESSKRTGLSSRCPVVSSSSISGDFNGDIAVGVNRDGVGNMSGTENKDAITFIQDFFNKAKSVIPTNYNGIAVGVLPGYIILFLCAIILFRFISH